jgi:hypothetical protein
MKNVERDELRGQNINSPQWIENVDQLNDMMNDVITDFIDNFEIFENLSNDSNISLYIS